jgi:hypothetical protein
MSNRLPLAYSHLPQVLAKRHLKISELHKKLKAVGVNVNYKSLYRLTSSAPLQKIDARIVGAICQTCAVGIQDVITFEQPKPVLQKLQEADQNRLDDLMTKHTEGKLSGEEMREFDELSEKAHELTMANARMLVTQRRAINSARRPQMIHGSIRTRRYEAPKRTAPAKRILQHR